MKSLKRGRPPGGVWSPWAKPALFAFLPRPLPEPPPGPFPTARHSPARRTAGAGRGATGAVGRDGGLALAEIGYRPVPLFNACPPPWDASGIGLAPAVVDVDAILAALVRGAERLRMLALAVDAPPAFLVDADRQTPRIPFRPGVFDNRSVLFPTDFPSATFLASQGYNRGRSTPRTGMVPGVGPRAGAARLAAGGSGPGRLASGDAWAADAVGPAATVVPDRMGQAAVGVPESAAEPAGRLRRPGDRVVRGVNRVERDERRCGHENACAAYRVRHWPGSQPLAG